MVTYNNLLSLADQISRPDIDADQQAAIYRAVEAETRGFTTRYTQDIQGLVDIIRNNGQNALARIALDPERRRMPQNTLLNRATHFLIYQMAIPGIFACTGGIVAELTKHSMWMGMAAGIALYIAGKSIFSSNCFRRRPVQIRPLIREPLNPVFAPLPQPPRREEHKMLAPLPQPLIRDQDRDLQRALAESLEEHKMSAPLAQPLRMGQHQNLQRTFAASLNEDQSLQEAIDASLRDSRFERRIPRPSMPTDRKESIVDSKTAREIDKVKALTKQICPLSGEKIPSIHAILINNVSYNVNHFVKSVLTLNTEEPCNPMNRVPLNETELNLIGNYFGISVRDFLNLFGHHSETFRVAERRRNEATGQLNHLPEAVQAERVVQIQNNFPNLQREVRFELFYQLLRKKGKPESFQDYSALFPKG
jgi:hypothetical protein